MYQSQNFFGNLWRMAVHNPQHLLSLIHVSDLWSCPGYSEMVHQATCKKHSFSLQQACNTQGKYLQMYNLIYVWVMIQALSWQLVCCLCKSKLSKLGTQETVTWYFWKHSVSEKELMHLFSALAAGNLSGWSLACNLIPLSPQCGSMI